MGTRGIQSCASTDVLAREWCGGGGGSGPVARAWEMHAWRICAGFAAIKPSGQISSGFGRWNFLVRRWVGRRIACKLWIVTGESKGLSPTLMFLPVLFCRVILPGPAVWMGWIHRLPGCTSRESDRCSSTSMPVKLLPWLAPGRPRIMASRWLKSLVAHLPRRVGPSSVVLRKGLMLQRIAAVWPETVHPSRCWGHRWIVSIQPTTDRCNSRLAGTACC